MKKIEEVFKQLSNLYEFNRKLQTFKIKTATKINRKIPDKPKVGWTEPPE